MNIPKQLLNALGPLAELLGLDKNWDMSDELFARIKKDYPYGFLFIGLDAPYPCGTEMKEGACDTNHIRCITASNIKKEFAGRLCMDAKLKIDADLNKAVPTPLPLAPLKNNNERRTEAKPPRVRRPQNRGKKNQK